MNTYEQIINELLDDYRKIQQAGLPKWAVHKIREGKRSEMVVPTIPFVGKYYAEQEKRILVYASAEVLTDYCCGEETNRPWLDDDTQAENRHRKCFEESFLNATPFFPNVHITPMNRGSLATAVMYLAGIIRGETVDEPRAFYETIAFGNYGKFSIETEYQRIVRENPNLSDREALKKEKKNINKDYAGNISFLSDSHEYIRSDIERLKPDYIIMPSVNDKAFLNSILNSSTKKIETIEIYQMGSRTIHSMGAEGRLNRDNKYKARDIESLPDIIQKAYANISGVSLDKYQYVFDHLDQRLQESGFVR